MVYIDIAAIAINQDGALVLSNDNLRILASSAILTGTTSMLPSNPKCSNAKCGGNNASCSNSGCH